MTVSLAEQIGTIDEIGKVQAAIAKQGGRDGYRAEQRVNALRAIRADLVERMNGRGAGKEE